MLNSGCDCCTVSGASIAINSVSVTKTCQPEQSGGGGGGECAGFTDPEDTSECPQRYSTRITTTTSENSASLKIPCGPTASFYINNEFSTSATTTTTESCGQETTTNQSGFSSSSQVEGICNGSPIIDVLCLATLTNDGWSGNVSGNPFFGGSSGSYQIYEPCAAEGVGTTTVTYSGPISDEEETFTPDPECEAEQIPFPEFPDKCRFGCQTDGDCDEPPDLEDGQGYSQNAFDFSINGEIVEQKFKYKIVHSAPSTCYLKVWTREKINKYVKKTPDPTDLLDPDDPCYQPNPQNYQYWEADEEEPFSYGGEQTYIWSGPTVKNGLCVDPEKGVGHCDNYEESSVRTVNAINGQEVFLEMKYSFVEGYEPDWPDEPNSCKPNGFPNTNCE
jgi:hypothetical protein